MNHVEKVEQEVEAEGTSRESPLFPIRVRERRLRLCQEARSVRKCKECPHYEECELVKQHMMDVKYELPKLQRELGDEQKQKDLSNPWLSML